MPIDDGSVDLTLAAQSAHWFDLPRFYAEVARVSRPGAVVALVTYALPHVSRRIDPFVFGYANQIIGPYWPPERAHIDAGYLTLPFPFEEFEPPAFEIEMEWTGRQFMDYVGTWSATQIYIRNHGTDPRVLIEKNVLKRWGDEPRTVRWPLNMRIGRVSPSDADR